MIDKEFARAILTQIKNKPTLVNQIDTVEEASWFDRALDLAIEAIEDMELKEFNSKK